MLKTEQGISFREISFNLKGQLEPLEAFLLCDRQDVSETGVDLWVSRLGRSVFITSLISALRQSVPDDLIFDKLGFLFSSRRDLVNEFIRQIEALNQESGERDQCLLRFYEIFSEISTLGFLPIDFLRKGAGGIFTSEVLSGEDFPDELYTLVRIMGLLGEGVRNVLFGQINHYFTHGGTDYPVRLFLNLFREDTELINALISLCQSQFNFEDPWEQYTPLFNSKHIDIARLVRVEQVRRMAEELLA
jgi:hypothetical protein